MLDKQLLYSAYRILTRHVGRDGSEKTVQGTCFHVKSGETLFLVTNRHNVELSFKDEKYVGYQLEGIQVDGFANNNDYFEVVLSGHTIRYAVPDNNSEDVFVIEIPKSPVQFRRRRQPGEDPNKTTTEFQPVVLGIEMLADSADFDRLAAGAPVFLPSYSAHYDANGERPIMRGGIISSDPKSDYQEKDQLPARRTLFQANSSGGASGGPVYALIGEEGLLLGINAGHLIGEEPRIGSIHSGFSYCFKATCIRECIDKIHASKQTTSKKPPPSSRT